MEELHCGQPLKDGKIDIVLPTTGKHGWIVSEAWVRSANEVGLLKNVFRPSAKWGAPEPEDDDNLFEMLCNDRLSNTVIVLGMDWHSQPLTFSRKWRDAWKKCSSKVIAIIWEDYNSQFVAENEALYGKMTASAKHMIECVDWVYSNHEDNLAFFEKQFSFIKRSYLPFSADKQIFQEYPATRKQPNTLCFKGFIKDFGFKDGPYVKRAEIAKKLEEKLGAQFVFHQENVTDGEYAKILSSFDYHINLPSFSQSMTARAAEILVTGALLFQYKPSGDKTNEFFQHGRDMIFYDPDDIDGLIEVIRYYLDRPEEAKRIAKNGHDRFMATHAMPKQVQMIYEHWGKNTFPSKPKPVIASQAEKTRKKQTSSKPNAEVLGKINWDALTQIDFEKVLYTHQFYLSSVTEAQYNRIAERWLNEYNKCTYSLPTRTNAEFLCISSMIRPDYQALFSKILSVIPNENRVVLENYEIYGDNFDIDTSIFMTQLMPLMKLIKAEKQSDVTLLYIKLCKYIYFLKKILEYNYNYLVCFADMQPMENLLAQYSKILGKKTITLQHGLYVDYKNYKTVNLVNYKHHVCDYFLAWGGDTANLIKRYHPDSKVVVCGKPIATLSEKVAERSKGKSKPYCSIIVDQQIFDEQNFEIFKIASSYAAKRGMDINVKFHPQSDRRKFKSAGFVFQENMELEKSIFILGHSSSLMYELMGRGVPVYRYRSNAPNLHLPNDILFSSEQELSEIMGRNFDYKKQFSNFVAHTGHESLEQYKRFFDSLKAS